MTSTPAFDPSDVFYELGDLAHMLDAIRLVIGEMSFETAGGGRNDDLDRVYSMVKIAQREALRLHEVTQVFDGPRAWGPLPYKGGQTQ